MTATDKASTGFRITPTDSTSLIGITSPAANYFLALFIGSNFIFAFVTIAHVQHWLPSVIAVLAVNGAAILLVLDRPDPYPMFLALCVIGAVTFATLLVAFQLPETGPVGRASWHLGANTWLLFFLALRRRALLAWIGYFAMAAVTVWWAVATGRGVVSGLMLLDTHAAILFVATLFGAFLRRTARRINDYEERAISGVMETAAADAAVDIRRLRVAELRSSAVPLLERLIGQPRPLSEAERREFRVAEALLRDGVRGRSLATPRISRAATKARDLGAEVTLLDDRGEALTEPGAMERVESAIGLMLDKAAGRSVTIRLHPRGRPVAVSLVSIGGEGSERLELDANGEPVARPEGFEPPTF